MDLIDLLLLLRRMWRLLLGAPLFAGLCASAYVLLVAPSYTARTAFLPPQQTTNAAATAALGTLGGNLGALAGAAGAGLRTPADQYVAILNSDTIAGRIVQKFDLYKVYDVEKRYEVLRELRSRVGISLGRRDGIITVQVTDKNAERAATMANQYVQELRALTAKLALTEAQQRRIFFEQHLDAAQKRLVDAEQALLASGFSRDMLKAEPRAAADAYAKARADLTAAELRLQALRTQLQEEASEVQAQASIVAGMRKLLASLESQSVSSNTPDYISKYREFKYMETLFESIARQFEIARLDESREGATIQIIDPALTPDFRIKPARKLVVLSVLVGTFLVTLAGIVLFEVLRIWRSQPQVVARLQGS